MRVKMFITHHLETLESEINEWLEGRSPTIREVSQSLGYREGKWKLVVGIWYEEEE